MKQYQSVVGWFSLLVYVMILLQEMWFKAILFLIVAPQLLIAACFWSVVFSQFRRLRKIKVKKVATKEDKIPLDSSSSIELPVPISSLAVVPPEAAWDPEYLIERDPRYREDETDSYGESIQDDETILDGNEPTYTEENLTTDWGSEGETFYQSDEYTDKADREDTEDFTESEFDGPNVSEKNSYVERSQKQDSDQTSEHYQTPGTPRPVPRSQTPELYNLPGSTLHWSSA